MRKPSEIQKDIEKLQKELKESESKIPYMKFENSPMICDLKLSIKRVVEDCCLNNKTIEDIDMDIKDSIIKNAIESFYGLISLAKRK